MVQRAAENTPPGVGRTWVEDRHGAGLPYSKGLMATSIMATGLSPGPAYRIAALIEEELVATGRSSVSGDELARLAARVLTREAGPSSAKRYLTWRRAKRSPQPMIVLIGGATGVGKSTVATKLAARLGITRVIPTDTIRQVMRTFLPETLVPELHASSFEVAEKTRLVTTSDPVLDGFHRQAEAVGSAVCGIIERMVVERKDAIIEGIHLVPGLLCDAELGQLRRQATVVPVVMSIDDIQVHRAHFLTRMENEHGRNPERYLRHLDDIRRIQDHLRTLAVLHHVPEIDASDLDEAIQAVLDRVVAAVTASRQDLGLASWAG